MSTIAYRDGIMAADTRAYSGDKTPIGRKHKIRNVNGILMGCTTTIPGLGSVVMDWYTGGMKGGAKELISRMGTDDVGFEFLAVTPDGMATFINGYGHPAQIEAAFYAIGSGERYALGAMEQGAGAERAVEVACSLDVWTAQPIEAIKHGDVAEMIN